MAPLMLLGLVFGLVAGFVMGWIGGRVYGRHEGRAALLRERCDRPDPHQPAPVPTGPAAPQLPPAGPVVLVVQNQHPAPATPTAVAGAYSQQLAELAMHLSAEHTRRYLPGAPDAITAGHTVDARAALNGEVA